MTGTLPVAFAGVVNDDLDVHGDLRVGGIVDMPNQGFGDDRHVAIHSVGGAGHFPLHVRHVLGDAAIDFTVEILNDFPALPPDRHTVWLPGNARFACQAIIAQLHAVQTQINGLDKRITQTHRANADSKRLETIPGFGVILSTAVVATMTDPKAFRTGREFAAWIGLVPRQNSTGGKERLGSISKQGDRYLRRLFVLGAISIVRTARTRPEKYPWLIELLARRPAKVVAVALANKMARVAWAVLARGETYRAPIRSSSAAIAAAA